MKKVDCKFVDFLVAGSPDIGTIDWIKDQVVNYENTVTCHKCDSPNVKITGDVGMQVKCESCGIFSSGTITLDKIPSVNYNDVNFLQEKKIIEILEAQGKV